MDSTSFMFKHWTLNHSELTDPPKFVFRVLDHFRDPMTRMIKEAILIRDEASLYSKSEYKGNKLARLTVE